MSDLEVTSGLQQSVIDKLAKVFTSFPEIEKVILYGSRAKGNFRTGSDIDLTVAGERLTHTQLMLVENNLENLHLPYKIDLSLFSEIENLELIDHIKRVGIVFFQNKSH